MQIVCKVDSSHRRLVIATCDTQSTALGRCDTLTTSDAVRRVVREWSLVLAPVGVLFYFVVWPDQLGALVGFLSRLIQ